MKKLLTRQCKIVLTKRCKKLLTEQCQGLLTIPCKIVLDIRTDKVSSTGPGRPTQSGAFAGGRRSREAERGERLDRGGRAGHAGKPPSDARGSGGRRYQHGFGGGADPRPRPRERPEPEQGPRCCATGAFLGRRPSRRRAPQLESSRTAEAERLLRLSDCGRRPGTARQKLGTGVCIVCG